MVSSQPYGTHSDHKLFNYVYYILFGFSCQPIENMLQYLHAKKEKKDV